MSLGIWDGALRVGEDYSLNSEAEFMYSLIPSLRFYGGEESRKLARN